MRNTEDLEKFIQKCRILGIDDYEINVNKRKLVKYRGNSKVVKIPYGIKNIGSECFVHNLDIEKVIIPATVKSIGARAFLRCINLKEIEIQENNIEFMGSLCFYGCKSLNGSIIQNTIEKCLILT